MGQIKDFEAMGSALHEGQRDDHWTAMSQHNMHVQLCVGLQALRPASNVV